MKNKKLECITDRNGFKVINAKSNQFRRRREVGVECNSYVKVRWDCGRTWAFSGSVVSHFFVFLFPSVSVVVFVVRTSRFLVFFFFRVVAVLVVASTRRPPRHHCRQFRVVILLVLLLIAVVHFF